MNVLDVVNRVKRQFGDESGVQITDTDIVNWINEAQQEITSTNEELLATSTTMNLVAFQQDYAMPADLQTLFGVSMKTSGALSYFPIKGLPIQQFNELISGWDGTFYGTDTPYSYTVHGSTLRLFPIPNAASTAGLKIFYGKVPTTIVGTGGALELPVQYHNAILAYALQQAYELDENYSAAEMKGGQYAARVAQNRGLDTKNPQETYGSITVLPDDAW